MKCANRDCYNEAPKGKKYCDRCWRQYQKARFPLQQSQRDIERLRKSSGHFVRSSSVEVEREPPPFYKNESHRKQREERHTLLDRSRRSPEPERKRKISVSPPPVRKKRRIDDEEEGSKQKVSSPFPSFEISKESKRSRVELPILFVPFEGNFSNRMIGGFEKKGNQTSSIVEGGDNSFVIERGKGTIVKGDMSSTFGSSSFWSTRKGDIEKMDLFSSNKKGVGSRLKREKKSTDQFFETVVEDRLRYLYFRSESTPEQGLPEIIVLSERLFDWPDELDILGHHYSPAFILGTRNLQDMAAYVLDSAAHNYRFISTERKSTSKGKSFTETWLLVSKVSCTPAFTIACVHLSSKYTTVRTDSMDSILNEVLVFARTKGVHALIGDLNLNTYGVHGGSFSVSNDFVMEKRKLSMKTMFATSNGGGDSVYMGGMICDSRVSFRPTLSTSGCCAVPPWFQSGSWKDEVFSDHHSLYGRYVFYGEERLFEPSNEVGGDCFFVALRAMLGLTEGVDALRQRIIDAISRDVLRINNLAGPRPILVQRPNSDSAVSVWCTSMRAYLAEMRQPGRWMEDTLLPFIAMHLRRRIIVQYGDHYAIFETDGGRDDDTGFIFPEQGDIFMNCQGNHFW